MKSSIDKTVDRAYGNVLLLLTALACFLTWNYFSQRTTQYKCDIDIAGHDWAITNKLELNRDGDHITVMLRDMREVFINRDLVAQCEEVK